MAGSQDTKVQQILAWFHNNKFFSILIVIGIIVIGLGEVFGALQAITDFFVLQPAANQQEPPQAGDSAVYDDVNIVLPVKLSGAEIQIDGEPAHVLVQSKTLASVRIVRTSAPHQIVVRKGREVCEKQVVIAQGGLRIYPCQE